MKTINKILLLITTLFLFSCATVKILQPTGGSKADGTVTLSYQYGMFEKPEIDWADALNKAREKCGRWGYSDAEAFGGGTRVCLSVNGYGNSNSFFRYSLST